MKAPLAVAILVLAQSVGAWKLKTKTKSVNFGPNGCVKLTRSTAGSCVISTQCEGVDTSHTEFAFDCVGEGVRGDVIRHSFGMGGFESNEEFDTEVKCQRCTLASGIEAPVSKPAAPLQKKEATAASAQQSAGEVDAVMEPDSTPAKPKTEPKEEVEAVAHAKVPKVYKAKNPVRPVMHKKRKRTAKFAEQVQAVSEDDAHLTNFHVFAARQAAAQAQVPNIVDTPSNDQVAKYGPSGCVSTYKSKEGHCILSTDCNENDIVNYEFGLVCVDSRGYPVKHMFGKNSFDPKETFDTLIKCHKCLGLENLPDDVILAGDVATMAKDISNLKAVMTNISINVKMLNDKVFPAAPSAGPAPAPVAAVPEPVAPEPVAAAPKKKKALVQHHQHYRRHLRHRRHHRREYDDDDEDDRDEDRRDDDYDDDRDRPERVQPAPVETPSPRYTPLNDVEQKAAEMQSTGGGEREDDDDDDGDDE